MQIKTILVLLPIKEEQKHLLEQEALAAHYVYTTIDALDVETLQIADIIIGNPPPEMLRDAPKLKWIQLNSAGSDAYMKKGVLKDDVLLTNATGAYGLAISEHMIGMLLQLLKKLHIYRNNQKSHLWHDEGEVKSIYHSKVLIIGLGNIGGEFAKRLKAFGAYTIGVKRTLTAKPDFIDELYIQDKIDELLPLADIVAITIPSTKETYKMFSLERLNRMKKGAVLLNVGRGNVVDTEALCDVVESGYLAGAGLDVTDPEPLPANHRLWDIENIILTPHISGGYHIPETLEAIVHISAGNLKRFMIGEKLINLVNFKKN
jgi:phosphoglycerate dehydrogenase-like enzyme